MEEWVGLDFLILGPGPRIDFGKIGIFVVEGVGEYGKLFSEKVMSREMYN